jgi:hypothetical protein
MRISPISAAALCLFFVALAAPITAQGGGKKKHAADSTQPGTSDQTLKTGQTVSTPFTAKSDLTLKSDVTASSGETAAEETLSNWKVPAIPYSPIVLKWEFNDKSGYAILSFNAYGGWYLEGRYDNKQPDRAFEAVIALKDENGNVFIFHHVSRAFKGKQNWGGENASGILTQHFRTLAKGFEVRGAFRFPTSAEGIAQVSADQNPACQTTAALAAGWGSIWTWAAPHHKCYQFNADG